MGGFWRKGREIGKSARRAERARSGVAGFCEKWLRLGTPRFADRESRGSARKCASALLAKFYRSGVAGSVSEFVAIEIEIEIDIDVMM